MVEAAKKDEKKKDEIPPDETASPYPPMKLAQTMHRLTVKLDQQLAIKTFDEIVQELENPSLYKILKEKLYDGTDPLPSSAKLTDDDFHDMITKNAAKLKELEDDVEQAIESAGDMEVMDARVMVARFSSKSLTQAEALAAYEKVLALPKVSSGKKIDSLMACARVASFYSDTAAADAFMDRAHKLAEAGGGADWDRRNRLKVYRALQSMLHRDLETASTLLLDCIATFSCVEMCSYKEFIVYAILTNMLHLPRPDLKKKVIDGPEVLSVSQEIPEVVRIQHVGWLTNRILFGTCAQYCTIHLTAFRFTPFQIIIQIKLVRAFYDCDYKAYLHAMVDVEHVLLEDRFLHPHAAYWMRELHILAYKQFLDSYQSVTLTAMAEAFGVSTDFIDYHASRFIAANRLTAKIDKYGGVIVTARPDLKTKVIDGPEVLSVSQEIPEVVRIQHVGWLTNSNFVGTFAQ